MLAVEIPYQTSKITTKKLTNTKISKRVNCQKCIYDFALYTSQCTLGY